MNKVTVKYRAHLSALTKTTEEVIEAVDVKSVLRILRQRHGKEAEKAAKAMIIALNGENILLLKRYKTVLKEGDVLSFFPLCAGG